MRRNLQARSGVGSEMRRPGSREPDDGRHRPGKAVGRHAWRNRGGRGEPGSGGPRLAHAVGFEAGRAGRSSTHEYPGGKGRGDWRRHSRGAELWLRGARRNLLRSEDKAVLSEDQSCRWPGSRNNQRSRPEGTRVHETDSHLAEALDVGRHRDQGGFSSRL